MVGKLFAVSCAALLMSGCTFLGITEQKTVKQQQVGESWLGDDDSTRLDVLSFPTQLRGAYAYRNPVNTGTDSAPSWKMRYVVCAEPFADIGMSSTLDTTLELINDISNSSNSSSEYSRNQENTGTITRRVEKSTVNEDGTVTTTVVSDYDNSTTRSKSGNGKRSLDLSQTANQSATAGLNATSTVVSLGGRTQYVVLARELLYRTCEMAANGFLNADGVLEQQRSVISALTKMLAAEEKTAEAKNKAAEAKLEEEKRRTLEAEALFIADPEVGKISGDRYRIMRERLTKKLIECSNQYDSIKDEKEKQKQIDDCRDKRSKQIQELGRQ